MVFLTEFVVGYVHGIEHTDYLHWPQPGAHWCKADNIAEEDAD